MTASLREAMSSGYKDSTFFSGRVRDVPADPEEDLRKSVMEKERAA